MTTRFGWKERATVVMLVLNVVGPLVYLWLGSLTWVIPEEREAGINTVTGEPFVWAVSALPILVFFLLLNVTWGVLILIWRQWSSGLLWLLAALIWFVTMVIDHQHR
jgi:hypothetical protein